MSRPRGAIVPSRMWTGTIGVSRSPSPSRPATPAEPGRSAARTITCPRLTCSPCKQTDSARMHALISRTGRRRLTYKPLTAKEASALSRPGRSSSPGTT